MANGKLRAAISQLRRVIGHGSGCTLTDPQLLEAFVLHRDEAAFEVLVWRHGTMVLSLCQRVLHDTHEAEDAFQATFLVFARKAGSISKRDAVGSWLYKVAYRIALRVRARAAKHSAEKEPVDELAAREAVDEVLWRDLRPVLDDEIDRLPEKYRKPFVLCYLEGHTNEEAAAQLGCPKGTILSRLARGRERLRSRLVRRGLTLSAGGLAAALSQHTATAAVPAVLVHSTIKAAIPFAAGQAAAGLVAASVAALTEGVLHTMFLTKLKFATAALLALVLLGPGAGWVAHQVLAQRTAPGTPTTEAKPDAARAAGRAGREDADTAMVRGKVVAVAKDGKGITLEIPAQARGEEPSKIDIKLGDKTAVTYQAVGPEGARPTEGYGAQVRLEKDTKNVAASVVFHGSQNPREPDVSGRIAAVAKDGKGITLEIAAPRARGEEPKRIELKLTDKTLVVFSAVARGEAKLAEGYVAQVWLADGPKGSHAARLHCFPSGEGRGRGFPRGEGREPGDVFGKVVAVAKDGGTITLEQPVRERGAEAKKIDVKLGDKTAVLFHNVGPDGTKVVEGLAARVWLEEGSKDRAGRVIFTGTVDDRRGLVVGKVVGIAKNGLALTLELAARGRESEAKRIDVKLTDKTRIAYFGVGPDGARPIEGYAAQIRLVEGSADTAAQVLLSKPGRESRR